MQLRIEPSRWPFSLPAGMFYCLLALAMHETLGAPAGPLALAALVASYLLPGTIALWTLADAEQRRCSLPYDFGSFVFFAWWILVPIYLLRTRGWRGLIPLAWFALLCAAAGIAGGMLAWLASLTS